MMISSLIALDDRLLSSDRRNGLILFAHFSALAGEIPRRDDAPSYGNLSPPEKSARERRGERAQQ
jgi:hypothetical protein